MRRSTTKAIFKFLAAVAKFRAERVNAKGCQIGMRSRVGAELDALRRQRDDRLPIHQRSRRRIGAFPVLRPTDNRCWHENGRDKIMGCERRMRRFGEIVERVVKRDGDGPARKAFLSRKPAPHETKTDDADPQIGDRFHLAGKHRGRDARRPRRI